MNIKIEKEVPLPTKKNEYPFEQMEIGDSFVIDILKKADVRFAISTYKKANSNFKFVTRTVSDGVRVWRIR